jgi:hypothetical protein
MNFETAPTDVLLSKYFHADLVIEGKIPGDATLGEIADILMELDARGVCARSETPPTWYTEADRAASSRSVAN